jgi:hypothetical protein
MRQKTLSSSTFLAMLSTRAASRLCRTNWSPTCLSSTSPSRTYTSGMAHDQVQHIRRLCLCACKDTRLVRFHTRVHIRFVAFHVINNKAGNTAPDIPEKSNRNVMTVPARPTQLGSGRTSCCSAPPKCIAQDFGPVRMPYRGYGSYSHWHGSRRK